MTTKPIKSKIVRPLRGGQITIPVEFRRTLGLSDDTLLEVSLVNAGEIRLRPVRVHDAFIADRNALRDLYLAFSDVREEVLRSGMTEDEINDAIDEAIESVRQARRDAPAPDNSDSTMLDHRQAS